MGTITNTQSMSRDLSTLVALAEVLADPAKLKELTEQMSAEAEIIQKTKADADQQLAEARRIQKQNSDLAVALDQQRVALEVAKADLKKGQDELSAEKKALEQAEEQFKLSTEDAENRSHTIEFNLKQQIANFAATSGAKEKSLASTESKLGEWQARLNEQQVALNAAESSYQKRMEKLKELTA